MTGWWRTLLMMSASGSLLGLILIAARRLACHRIPSRLFFAAWLLVIVRFLAPVPALAFPERGENRSSPAAVLSAAEGELSWQREIDVIR